MSIKLFFNLETFGYYDSDHSPIYTEIKYKNTERKAGPGFWKFNDPLLENEEFVTNLKFFIIHAKEKHSNTKDKKLYWEMIPYFPPFWWEVWTHLLSEKGTVVSCGPFAILYHARISFPRRAAPKWRKIALKMGVLGANLKKWRFCCFSRS